MLENITWKTYVLGPYCTFTWFLTVLDPSVYKWCNLASQLTKPYTILPSSSRWGSALWLYGQWQVNSEGEKRWLPIWLGMCWRFFSHWDQSDLLVSAVPMAWIWEPGWLHTGQGLSPACHYNHLQTCSPYFTLHQNFVVITKSKLADRNTKTWKWSCSHSKT